MTAVAAATDAVTYLRLGAFPANMTGNTVLIAVGLASHQWHAGAVSAAALGGFIVGAAGGGAASVRTDSRARFLAGAVAVEAVLLAGAALLWRYGGTAGAHRYPLIATLGAAMGLQSASVSQLRAGVSTTYITGTWTAVSRFAGGRAGQHRRAAEKADEPPHLLQAAVLGCYFAAALVAAVIYHALTT